MFFPSRRKPLKDFFASLIKDEKELNAFGLWAFGEGLYDIMDGLQFLEAWNGLHGNELKLEPSSLIGDDALKMIKMWRDSLA